MLMAIQLLFSFNLLGANYPVVDTGIVDSFSDTSTITKPGEGGDYYGQDSNYTGNQPSYTDNGDGTITDNVTGLMWAQDMGEMVAFDDLESVAVASALGGYTDWRVPTLKELYSLILFTGQAYGESAVKSFIDEDYFIQPWGDTSAGEREIDAQTWSSTQYVGTTMGDDETIFGVNFVDGRIKGYPKYVEKTTELTVKYLRLVRGVSDYGLNDFVDNGDGTISDLATGLMWQQYDDGNSRDWKTALSYSEGLSLAGHSDWRLPNIKELHSIVDYTRSPQTTSSAAIDPIFGITSIYDPEGNSGQYPYFWSSTTHLDTDIPAANAAYFAFGEAQGYMNNTLMDVHGAGAQRSDPKSGNASDYPQYWGPQGDVQYVYNYVRCVRDMLDTDVVVGATEPYVVEGEQSVFFKRPATWSGNIYVYVYYGDSEDNVVLASGSWPGTSMEFMGSDIFKYSFDSSLPEIGVDATWYILFSDGANQTEGDPGFVCMNNWMYSDGGAEYEITNKLTEQSPTLSLSIDPTSGSYLTGQQATLTSVGANVYYTLDGTTPSAESMLYTAPIMLSDGSVRLRAIAYKDNEYSAIVTETYTITEESEGAITVKFKLPDGWSAVYMWAWADDNTNLYGTTWPGAAINDDGDGWWSYTFSEELTSVNLLFNNGASSNTIQTGDITGVTKSTSYIYNGEKGVPTVYVDDSSVADVTANDELVVYPSPAEDYIMVKFNNLCKVEIYSLATAANVKSKVVTSDARVNISSLTSGIYMVKAYNSDGAVKVTKIIKR